jgi:hypothetical protein
MAAIFLFLSSVTPLWCEVADSTVKMQSGGSTVEAVHIKAVPGAKSETGAKLCVTVATRTSCYIAKVNGKPFPIKPEWRAISVTGRPGVARYLLYTALREPFFSRQDKHMALLALDSGRGDLRDVLPPIILSEQSEYSIWQDNRFSPLPIVTTADFQWDIEKETHFGPHQYRVNTYLYDDKGKYVVTDSYLTERRYPGLDDASQIAVIWGEMNTLRQHLAERSTDQFRIENPAKNATRTLG